MNGGEPEDPEEPRRRVGKEGAVRAVGPKACLRDLLNGGKDRSEEILEGKMSRTILVLSFPVIISSVFQISYNLVDTYWVGRLGPDALAAITLGFPFLFLFFSIGIGISIGITSATARLLGAGKVDEAGELASHGIVVSLFMTIVMMGLAFLTLEGMVRALGASSHVKEMACSYISIIIFGTGFSFINLACSGIIRAEGNMVIPMYALIAGVIINIILDPIMIFGWFGFPELGVAGAALATIIAQSVVMSIVVLYIVLGRTAVRIRLRAMRFRLVALKEIFRVGLPSSILHLTISLAIFMYTALAAAVSDNSVASLGLGFRLNSVALMPAFGLNVAIITIVGQNVGAGNFDRVRKAVRTGIGMAAVYMAATSLIYLTAPSFWLGLFTDDATVIDRGVLFLWIVTPSYVFLASSIVISGAFQGAGNAVPPMVIMSVRMILISVPVAWVLMFPFGMGLVGLFIGIAVGNVFSAVLAYLWFRKGTWMKGHAIVERI